MSSESLSKNEKRKNSREKNDPLADLRNRFINSGITDAHQSLTDSTSRNSESDTYEIQKNSKTSISLSQNTIEADGSNFYSRNQFHRPYRRKRKSSKDLSTPSYKKGSLNQEDLKRHNASITSKSFSYRPSASTTRFGYIFKSISRPRQSSRIRTDDVKLFTDTNFMEPLIGYYSEDQVAWRRVKAVNQKAQFFVEFTKYPIQLLQNQIGTCALSSAVQLIMHNKILFDSIVPKDQDFEKKYNGSFNFWFWKYGKWKNIVIDDFLPFDFKNPYEPLFSVLNYKNSYWYSLLEKAYAKFYGSYFNLSFVTLEDALQDLTGGLVEYFDLENTVGLQEILTKTFLKNSIIGLYIKEFSVFKTLGQPLICNTIYRLEDIIYIKNDLFITIKKTLKVVNEVFAPKYNLDQDVTSLSLYLDRENTGTENKVSISIDAIRKYFKSCKIVNFTLTKQDKLKLLKSGLKAKYWLNVTRIGKWTLFNSGGNPQFSRTYWKNPQYRFKIGVTDDRKSLHTVVLGLLVYEYPVISSYSIGFSLYEVNCGDKEIWNIDLNESNCVLIGQHELEPKRQITQRFVVPAGMYAFIPYTSLPRILGSFIVRLFYDNSVYLYMWELNTFDGTKKPQRLLTTVANYSQNVNVYDTVAKFVIIMLIIGIICYTLMFII